jgi:transketolase
MRQTLKRLTKLAAEARYWMVEALVCAGCGHPGGAFSAVEMLVALYFKIMRIHPSHPRDKQRDRFILSKGHASVALYTVLHLKKFFGIKTLLSFRQDHSSLGGHPDMRKVPGVEMSTGSLGHGLSVGCGMAYAAKMDHLGYRTFVLMGDGETQEGSVWEAAMFAAHYQLDNLIAIVDRNRIQIDGFTENVMSLEPYRAKWKSFGWEVREVDGHYFAGILKIFSKLPFKKGKPSLVISNTIKGKGISFMENRPEWHGKGLKGDFALRAKQESKVYFKRRLL